MELNKNKYIGKEKKIYITTKYQNALIICVVKFSTHIFEIEHLKQVMERLCIKLSDKFTMRNINVIMYQLKGLVYPYQLLIALSLPAHDPELITEVV